MHAPSNFTITLTATKSEINKLFTFLDNVMEDPLCLDCYTDFGDEECNDRDSITTETYEVEECYDYALVDAIERLAVRMAQLAPKASFIFNGFIDMSESNGQYQNFMLEYSNKTLVSHSSDWYTEYVDGGNYFADYEEFCDEFWDDEEDQPQYSEEEFEEFCQWESMYVLDNGNNDIVSEVPLNYITEINIADFAAEKHDGKDERSDDEDFEDED